MHTQNNNVFNDDKCKKVHRELFNIVLKELISIDKVHIQNDAGNKDTSPISKIIASMRCLHIIINMK